MAYGAVAGAEQFVAEYADVCDKILASYKIAPERLILSVLASRLDKQTKSCDYWCGFQIAGPCWISDASIISRQPTPGDCWHHSRGPGPGALIVDLHESSRLGQLTRVPVDHHGDLQ